MIRILLVDDQQLARAGLRVILNSEPEFEVVGEAADGAEAVDLARELDVDVICMDVEMPVMTGIEASRRILAETGSGTAATAAPAILILTTFGHETYLFEALAAGVSGFLLKTSRAEQLIEAVRTLASGQALLGPDVTRAVIERIAADRTASGATAEAGDARASGGTPDTDARAGSSAVPGSRASVSADPPPTASQAPTATREAFAACGLTEREREVMRHLAQGLSNSEIAAELFLGEATVKTHVSNILQKLGVRDRIQAVVWAHTHGMLGG